jgi:KipI family sensor histidine kinase inhibitor
VSPLHPRLTPLGDAAWLVEFDPVIAEEVNARVLAIADALRASGLPGVRDIVPAYTSLAVHYDPLRWRGEELGARIDDVVRSVPERPAAGAAGPAVEVPVCYGGAHGPDLSAVAAWARCSPADVVAAHAGVTYRVFMIGFLPGFPYLARVDPRIAMPRREVPRTHVAAGSVGIAGQQTGIYPAASPGGWQIVGRTPLRLFDLARDRPALLSPGQQVRYVPIDQEAYDRLAAAGPSA